MMLILHQDHHNSQNSPVLFQSTVVLEFTSFSFAVQQTPTRHFFASSFLKPISLIRVSTWFFRVIFGLHFFRNPLTPKFNAFFRMVPSSIRHKCSYHLTAAASLIFLKGTLTANLYINSFVFFLSINFTSHMAFINRFFSSS